MPVSSAFQIEPTSPLAKRYLHVVRPCPPDDTAHRVVRLLESRLPAGEDGPVTIMLGESRQELASYLAMKPETMSRVLRTLSVSGAVTVRGRLVDVASRARLLENLHGQVV